LTGNTQASSGGVLLMATLFGAFPFLTRLFADGGLFLGTSTDDSGHPS
jgi:hypothetical protein